MSTVPTVLAPLLVNELADRVASLAFPVISKSSTLLDPTKSTSTTAMKTKRATIQSCSNIKEGNSGSNIVVEWDNTKDFYVAVLYNISYVESSQ